MRRASGAPVGVRDVPALRLGEVRMRPGGLEVLEQRLRGTKFVSLAARSIMNSPEQTGMDFWSINPYVGCEFGCTYCYARYAHRYVVERARDRGRLSGDEFTEFRGPHGWEAFERRIFVKQNVLSALDADLRRYFRSAALTTPIVLGTATDPYQPAERRFRLTRAILDRLARYESLSIGIITKSPLVTRDVDVLARLGARSDLEVYVSLISADAALVRRVEARSPVPAARLRALRKLAAAGINAGLIVAPVLPGISDGVAHLEALFRAAREAGAKFVHAGPLRLYGGVRERFLPVLETQFPHLTERYTRAYARHTNAPRAYAAALQHRVQRLQAKYGFPVNRGMEDRYQRRRPAPQGELAL
jgi:DNA repair photolyase